MKTLKTSTPVITFKAYNCAYRHCRCQSPSPRLRSRLRSYLLDDKYVPLESGFDTKGLVINYGEGGYKMGKSRVQNFLRPHLKTG